MTQPQSGQGFRRQFSNRWVGTRSHDFNLKKPDRSSVQGLFCKILAQPLRSQSQANLKSEQPLIIKMSVGVMMVIQQSWVALPVRYNPGNSWQKSFLFGRGGTVRAIRYLLY